MRRLHALIAFLVGATSSLPASAESIACFAHTRVLIVSPPHDPVTACWETFAVSKYVYTLSWSQTTTASVKIERMDGAWTPVVACRLVLGVPTDCDAADRTVSGELVLDAPTELRLVMSPPGPGGAGLARGEIHFRVLGRQP